MCAACEFKAQKRPLVLAGPTSLRSQPSPFKKLSKDLDTAAPGAEVDKHSFRCKWWINKLSKGSWGENKIILTAWHVPFAWGRGNKWPVLAADLCGQNGKDPSRVGVQWAPQTYSGHMGRWVWGRGGSLPIINPQAIPQHHPPNTPHPRSFTFTQWTFNHVTKEVRNSSSPPNYHWWTHLYV